MSQEITLECPKCKDADLDFVVEFHRADDGDFAIVDLVADEYRNCKCSFSDDEIENLRPEVASHYWEGIFEYEP